jgi:hypothetical protein
VGDFFRWLFKLPKSYPRCALNTKHPLFKQQDRDHRGLLLDKPKNFGLLKAIVDKLDDHRDYWDSDCGLNSNFECPCFHKQFTKITQQELEDLLIRLKVEFSL